MTLAPFVSALTMLLLSAVLAGASEAPTTAPSDTLPTPPAGKEWKLGWHDEFDGATLDATKWTCRPEGRRRDGWWSSKAVALDGKGHLAISVVKDGGKYLSACIDTSKKFEHDFGYYVCRVQFQKQPGYWSAFWLTCHGAVKVGDEGRDGTEIDIYERRQLGNQIEHNLHWDGYGKDHKHAGHSEGISGLSEGWHTTAVWWKPNEYVFYIDGKEVWRTGAGGISQVPEYILLSNEVGKWGGDISKAKLPDSFLVDYVRVYDLIDKP